jgi:DNA-binding SARP family transcriptional activator
VSGIGHDPHRQTRSAALGVAQRSLRAPQLGPEVSIRLFGAVQLAWRGHEVRLSSRNARALLAVLTLDRRDRFRDAVAADLWPELPEHESGAAMRQALWLLRTAMAESGIEPVSLLDCDRDRIGFRAGVVVDVDVARFHRCVADRPARVEEAIDLYRGDLAEGMNVECLAREREQLADLFEDVLAEAAARRMRAGDLVGARDAAVRLLRRDPLREEAHAVLIELHGLSGSRSQVARQYRRLRTILANELGVEPLQETTRAYQVALRRASINSRATPLGA